MSETTPDQIRVAAMRLIDQARARGNSLCLSDAEEGVRASLALKARRIPPTPGAAAIAVAAVDREAIRHLTTICKILPMVGKDPTRLKAALEGHFLPEDISLTNVVPVETRRSRSAARDEAAFASEAAD